ncbi:hypothetical protein [Neorhizobium galegae]|uniref:Uncharacterized protein n=1 Tax=Neorhizobium galegae bv. officinalis TaxID=323656 RepID=A0A0T7GYI8_NEOGA|nr:hypothetical protein [Neorhizobium galegae]CDZ52342.1 Hypothetical protein NGAL_HAMBI1189_44370 [Neorhizobium galegae bv. officinalis]
MGWYRVRLDVKKDIVVQGKPVTSGWHEGLAQSYDNLNLPDGKGLRYFISLGDVSGKTIDELQAMSFGVQDFIENGDIEVIDE